MAATVPVQHRTLPEEGYDAASYLVGYGGSGHVICITFAFMVIYILKHWTCFFKMWISGSISLWLRFVYLFHMKLDVLNVIHPRLICHLMNL